MKLATLLPGILVHMMVLSISNWVDALEHTVTTADANYETKESEKEWEVWSNVSSADPLVKKMWSSTYKYTKFSRYKKWVLDCVKDYNDANEVAAPFLLLSSLKSNTYFVEKYVHYEISKYSKYHDIQRINRLYHEYVQIVINYIIYNDSISLILANVGLELKHKLKCPSDWHCGCLSLLDIYDFQYELNTLTDYDMVVKNLVIFMNYIDPVLRIVIISVGLILNISIARVILSHKDLRTESNIIIFNLILNDVFYLVVYVPLQYFHYYFYDLIPHGHFSYNGVYIYIQSVLFSASAFSILALYFQRYFATSSVRRFSDKIRCVFYIAAVWVSASVVAVAVFLLNRYEVGGLEINSVSTVYLALLKGLPITMFILSRLTKRKLKKFDEDRRAEIQEFMSSKLTKTLCFIYWFTHTPLFMWLCIEKGVHLLSLHLRFNYVYIELLFYYLLFLYPILNSVTIINLCDNIKNKFKLCRKRQANETDTVGTESLPGTINISIM